MHCGFVQVIIPLMIWESTEFSRPVLAVVLVCSLAIFPMFILPSGPSMWLSGMMFGYGLGFLIIMSGTMIGQTLPYFIGQWLLHDRIQVSLCPCYDMLVSIQCYYLTDITIFFSDFGVAGLLEACQLYV